jgi:RNA-directed DNA polymerase
MTTLRTLSQQKPLDRSPFWKVTSPRKLAELLRLPVEELESISASWCAEYKQFELDERWIETPKKRLHRVQRMIHNLLSRSGPPDYLHSGFRGRSAHTCALQHDGAKPMVKIDIRKFYPSSDGRLVFELFREKFQCSEDVAAILFKLCTIKGTQNRKRAHLPTGGVTSPILAYFCYMNMFEKLAELAAMNGLVISVLADDVCMSGDRADGRLLREAEEIIVAHGLKSHWKKRKAWPSTHPNKIVTGVQITPKGLRVPLYRKQRIAELENELLQSKSPKDRAKAYQKLCGGLSSAGQIEPKFASRAEAMLVTWRADAEAWKCHLEASAARRPKKRHS